MQTKLNQAQLFRKTAAKLIRQAELLESGIDIRQCIHGEYTNEPVNIGECKTCGKPTWVICRNKKVVADRVNSNYCKTCKHFENININNEV